MAEFYMPPNDSMSANFGDNKYIVFRRLCVQLMKCEKALGLNITTEQIQELERNLQALDLKSAAKEFLVSGCNVTAHINIFAAQCPKAAAIIDLEATSCYVGDNSDIILVRDGLNILLHKLATVMNSLANVAVKYKELPTLIHDMKPIYLTTVGRKVVMWISDFLLSFENLKSVRDKIWYRGVKGTTSTYKKFLTIFEGDHQKVKTLDKLVSEMAGFKKSCNLTDQSDSHINQSIVTGLTVLWQSIREMCVEIELLAEMKEIEDLFDASQMGSSVIRNPLNLEMFGIVSLPFGFATDINGYSSLQDGKAHITLAEKLLSFDEALILVMNVADGLVMCPEVITSHVTQELPFIGKEDIVSAMIKAGGDRQVCHEEFRVLSHQAAEAVQLRGEENDLVERIRQSTYFAPIHEQLDALLDPTKFVGRAPQQVTEFLEEELYPALSPYKEIMQVKAVPKV